jgi:uncharacterized protein (DUF983 family)
MASPSGHKDGRGRLAREPNSELQLDLPAPRWLVRSAWRAFRLRCPSCGRGPVLVHWLRLRERCGSCGLALERGESDYFIGAMMFNLGLSELLFAAALVTFLAARWPAVPWDTVQIVAPIGMALAPVLLFPVSKLAWLAFDLAFRPPRKAPPEP